MKITNNHDIKALNTFRLPCCAQAFVELNTLDEIARIAEHIKATDCRYLVIGGGSNLLLPEHYVGLVIHNKLSGIKCVTQDTHNVTIEAMAGENWDNFVAHTIAHGWYGLENLSLIPGTVGASPIQNIGAYGVEVKQFIDYVKVYDLAQQQFKTLTNSECEFSYRHSIFKHETQLLVVAVGFKLSLTPKLNIAYKDVAQALASISQPTPSQLRDCVVAIRRTKLPDPALIGNVGSFFHNPIVATDIGQQLKQHYPQLPLYVLDEHKVKLSAGWLIDNLGLKGYVRGNVGVYAHQALVLVNIHMATQSEVLDFARFIQDKVIEEYGVQLNIEPLVISKD